MRLLGEGDMSHSEQMRQLVAAYRAQRPPGGAPTNNSSSAFSCQNSLLIGSSRVLWKGVGWWLESNLLVTIVPDVGLHRVH